ncbi:hypothetical protein MMF83_00028385 [Klebsiella pneumoniae]
MATNIGISASAIATVFPVETAAALLCDLRRTARLMLYATGAAAAPFGMLLYYMQGV